MKAALAPIAWAPIATAPENTIVETRIDDANGVRNEQKLRRMQRALVVPGHVDVRLLHPHALETRVSARDPFPKRMCRGCCCTEHNACVVQTDDGLRGCAWVMLEVGEPTGLCDTCAVEFEWDQLLMRDAFTLDELTMRSLIKAQGPQLVLP